MCNLNRQQNKKRRIGDLQKGEESDAISLSSSSSVDDQSECNQINNNLNGVSSSDDDEQSFFSKSDDDKDDKSVIEIDDSGSELSANEDVSTMSTQSEVQVVRNDDMQHQGEDSDDNISFNDPAAPELNFDESDSEDEMSANESYPVENILDSEFNDSEEQTNNVGDDTSIDNFNVVEPSPDFESDSGSEDESDAYNDDDDDEVLENIQKYHQHEIAHSPLEMAMQGFQRPPQSIQTKTKPTNQTSTLFDPSSIVYRGKQYHINRCYRVENPTNKVECTVAILRFIDEKTARCILVCTFEDTFLGIEGEGYEIDATMQKERVQVYKHVRNLHMSSFKSHPSDGQEMPKWIYEPRKKGSWHTFGYFYDRNKVRKKERRSELLSLEFFAGAGGSLLGYHHEGFETVMAVEKDEDASKTLKENNPRLKVHCGCVRKFLEDYDKMSVALGRVDHIHFSSPCQDFSRANRHQRSGRRERADLSLLLLDFVRKTSCSTACFENVTGIFDRNNVAYLKKLSIGLLKLGYQIRCSVLKACDYGDPQKVSCVQTNIRCNSGGLIIILFPLPYLL